MSRPLAYVAGLPAPLRRMIKRLPGVRKAQAKLAGVPAGPTPEPGQLRPVVYLPTWARWDEMRQRPQYLLEAFARAGHDVYFVDPREERPRMADGVCIVPSVRFVPRSHVILYVHFAPVREMFDVFDDPAIVYDILDDLTIYDEDEVGMPEGRRVRAHHPHVMERADVVTASSRALVSTHLGERADILLVENGVDPDRFGGEHQVPTVLASLTGPIVGYHGAVAKWFDLDLYGQVALALSHLAFVIVGPADPRVQEALDRVAALPNVTVIDAVASDEIASYVATFDVAVIPWIMDSLTEAVTPLKLYEYLAAGIPVVSVPLPVCIAHPLVRTASGADEFASQVSAALSADRDADFRSRAVAAAADASWVKRAAIIRTRLEERGQLRVEA